MVQDPKLLWDRCLDIIRDNITPQQFAVSFAFVKCYSFDNGNLVLSVPSEFIKEFLEKNFIPLMSSTFKRVYGNQIKSLAYIVNVADQPVVEKPLTSPTETSPTNGEEPGDKRLSPNDVTAVHVDELDSQLRAEYNFHSFLEGESNRLARSVGEAVAQKPAKTFNPLFVYGPSGCGKTHLINAIGLRTKELHPQMRVLYLSAHLFYVQYTDAVMNNKVPEFIRFYQTIDMLILDDIQEFSGKKGTQNTFFHIFNHLQLNGKQIILAADRPPIAIKDIEDRLLTRFKWGMQAEIERPTENLRLDILMAKVRKDGLDIPQEILHYISENLDESIRDLEGIITSLLAYSVCYNSPVNMELVKKVMPRYVTEQVTRQTTINEVKDIVCNHFNISVANMDSESRRQKYAYARMIAMFLANEFTDKSIAYIGSNMGGRSHATVIHAVNKIKELMTVDKETRENVETHRAFIKK